MNEDRRPIVFPTLAGRTWRTVDLNALAAKAYPAPAPNPLLDPDFCARFVDDVARDLGTDFTFGGYLEDRGAIWRGHYHDEDSMRHLGVDYNAPAGTPVVAPADCEVVHVFRDPNRDGGWGGVVYLRLERPYRGADYVLYGHLAHAGLPEVGAVLRRGDVVGDLGAATENGGWFPHLHVQCFDDSWYRRYRPSLEEMDGYGPNATTDFPSMPDPTDLVAGRPY